METEEDRLDILDRLGTNLKFDSNIINGFLGFQIYSITDGENSIYLSERKEYDIQISTKQAFSLELAKDDEFTITDGTYIYNFILTQNPIENQDGWSTLRVNYLGKEEADA